MDNLTGKQLGPYRIVAPLGEGGMAAIYKAYQPAMDRDVAIKVLPRQLAHDPQFVGRFKQEAQLLARLQHPHILAVFDFGESEDYTYLVMPLVESGTLTDLLAGRPLPLTQIRQIISQVGDALDYAHSRGLVHRDVKPSNILIDARGNCLLTDFGIAKLVEGTAKFTNTGGLLGTPAYMSPEQGRGVKVDSRADIYALGVVLYEMVTGRVPFDAETPLAIVFKHVQDPLPLPSDLNSQMPEAVERVILKALAKDPDDRFATAGDMVRALQAAIPLDAPAPQPAANTAHAKPTKATIAPSLTTPVARPPVARPLAKPGQFRWGPIALGLFVVAVCLLVGGIFGSQALIRAFAAPSPSPTSVVLLNPTTPPLATPTAPLTASTATAPLPTSPPIVSGVLKVVADLPLTGADAAETTALNNAIDLAFSERNHTVCDGQWQIAYEAFDHTSPATGNFDLETAAAHAGQFAADPDIVAILGPYHSRVAKIMLPIVNPANLIVISPGNTDPRITKAGLGLDADEPDRYFPSGQRTYARVIATDEMQGAAAAYWAKSLGAGTVSIINDRTDYGRHLSSQFETTASAIGLTVLVHEQISDARTDLYAGMADKLTAIQPDLIYFSAILDANTIQFIQALRTAGYAGQIVGGDTLFIPQVLNLGQAAEGLYVTSNYSAINPQASTAVLAWREAYAARYGAEPMTFTVYGYLAANLLMDVFDSVCRQGGSPADRETVRAALFDAAVHHSPLGDYVIDPNGDTTLVSMSGWQVQKGEFAFVSALNAIDLSATAPGTGPHNEPAWQGGVANIDPANNIGQSFVATLATISSVEVDLMIINQPAAADSLDLRILSKDGHPLIEVLQTVPAGFEGWLAFKFPQTLAVTVGETYLISLQDTGKIIFGWKYAGDTYPDGAAILRNASQAEQDYFFRINP